MRLDFDCIRDILLVVESLSSVEDLVYYPDHWPKKSLKKFSDRSIRYHIRQCIQEGFLLEPENANFDYEDGIYITDLSYSGHAFLACIRKDTAFEKFKKALLKLGNLSLNAAFSVASNLVSHSIIDGLF